jgi:hypothetical protein
MITLLMVLLGTMVTFVGIRADEFENLDINKIVETELTQQPVMIEIDEVEINLPESKQIELKIEKELEEYKKKQKSADADVQQEQVIQIPELETIEIDQELDADLD